MVIKDDNTLLQALALVELTPVWYSDQYRSALVTDSERLETLARGALNRGSIAIVTVKGQEEHMESFSWELKMAKRERAQKELQQVRAWVRANPERVAKVAQKHLKE